MKNVLLISSSLLALTLVAQATSPLPESQKIDQLLAKDWQKHGVSANPPASDDVLVRRLYLDITGRIPTIEETRSFVESRDPAKRTKLIDRLLEGDGYTSHMFNYFADLLRLTDNNKARLASQAYEEWLKKKLKANTPYDQLVRDLLTTEGAVWDSGAIGFYLRDENKLDHLAYTVQVFLGTQIVCAQCHNHPFDKWTQMDYYQMAAFTYGMDNRLRGGGLDSIVKGKEKTVAATIPKPDLTGKTPEEAKKLTKQYRSQVAAARKKTEVGGLSRDDAQEVKRAMQDVTKPLRYTQIAWKDDALPKLPDDYSYSDAKPGQQVLPRAMFGHDAEAGPTENRLQAFARWMTSPENPRFTTVIANRMWKSAFGLGLIEPVDEMMDSTVASNPELMDYLTQLMIEKKYSLKSFLRVLYNTDTYQRMASTQEVALGETSRFTGPLLRRMSAEQIWDSVATLVAGNIDSTVEEDNVRLHQYLDDLQFFVNTVKTKGVEGLVEISKKVNDQNDANLAALEEKRKALVESGKETDVAQAKALAQEANRLRSQKSRDMLVALLGEERAAELRRGYNEKAPSQNKRPQLSKAEIQKLKNLPKDQRKSAMEALQPKTSLSFSARASEQPSPARPGTFLRTFGQSDREEIDNFNRSAAIPQALALLNSPIITTLTRESSVLSKALEAAPTAEKRAALLYEALLSRRPNADEQRILSQVLKERGDTALEDIAHALLTGSQFLFIQ
ncbi:MAG: DUF1549 domain-containing protein [Verrucomicrobiaceae bacterium]|nr:DUF1549 domain-containing protein [Verrucomicrobiaceae bacterium]